MLKKFNQLWRSLGPGFIMASLVLGPGSITVASKIGSEHAYKFLWVILVALIFMLTYTSMAARFGVVSNKTILKVIGEKYGKWLSVAIGVSAFLAATSFQFGNNLGIGIGMQGITGIKEYVWPLIFTPAAILLTFFAKNLYKILEKMMMIMVMIMIVSFLINLILTKPDPVEISRGLIPGNVKLHNLEIIVALLATSFSLTAAIYQSYLAQNKGWNRKNIRKSLIDTMTGISILAGITLIIMITSAAALYPQGIVVKSVADMAIQLEDLFGSYAKIIFSIGLSAAAFSSLMVNAVIGGGLISDGLGLGKSMNDNPTKIFIIIILAAGMLVSILFKGDVIYALVLAQASSIIAVPLIAIGLLLIVNSKQIMGELKNTFLQNSLAIIGLVTICLMVYFMFDKFLSLLHTV